ncbi:thermosome subunit [Candidatus Pacearchaeota archaeon]|nr:thermosome subunit [Candidatus Pacearchaeota archaeon]
MSNEKQPIYIMPENVQRTVGRDAQRNNILAAKIIADTVKTTLGPKGMDKMLVDSVGNIIITNDGVTILEEMEIEHPAAKMMVDIAKTQENEVGDGTTTAVLLAGKLLENAEKLLDMKIHPTVIIKGYKLATVQAEKILEEIAIPVNYDRDDILRYVAMTAMTGKGAENDKEKLADIIVRAIKRVSNQANKTINLDDIKIEKSKGQAIENSELIQGLVIDKERVNIEMPTLVNSAKIALVDFALEVRGPEGETRISITSPEQLQGFMDREEKMLKEMTSKILASGANVVFCQRGIDDLAQYYLAKLGIYACRRVSKSDMEKLARATGGHIISNINELNTQELGKASIVREVSQGEDKMTYIEGCENPRAVTILIRGGTGHVIDEIERAIRDGLGDISSVLKQGKIVAGAGAIEIELSKKLREFSSTLSGREQLAVEEFARALESIPSALAENAGLDPIDIITELRARHDKGERYTGINLLSNKIENVLEAGVIEPMKTKTQALSSASEVAMMILRIDDVLAANSKQNGKINSMPNLSEDF